MPPFDAITVQGNTNSSSGLIEPEEGTITLLNSNISGTTITSDIIAPGHVDLECDIGGGTWSGFQTISYDVVSVKQNNQSNYIGAMECDAIRLVNPDGLTIYYELTYIPRDLNTQKQYDSILLFPNFVIIGLLAIMIIFKIIQWPSAWKGTQNDTI